MTAPAIIRSSFILAGFVALASLIWPFPRAILVASLVLAAGQLWAARDRGAWLRAVLFLLLGGGLTLLETNESISRFPLHPDLPLVVGIVASILLAVFSRDKMRAARIAAICVVVGLFFSALDADGVSSFWRASILAKKSVGGLPQVSWSDVRHEVFGTRIGFKNIDVDHWARVIDRKPGPNGDIELFRTELGDMWAPAVNHVSVALIAQEIVDFDEYQIHEHRIRPGDVVIDCGGHVGFYTKLALRQGASLVVAFEPDPENHGLFSQNLQQEIADGRVILIKAGVWDERDELVFHHSKDNPGAHGFFGNDGEEVLVENVPVLPLDDQVEELGLQRVDWIKMDIEGAEQRALKGAARTLAKFRPSLAICTYHRQDDPDSIPPIVLAANSAYTTAAKRIAANGFIRPKVLFFY